jgi:Rrf2 family protein
MFSVSQTTSYALLALTCLARDEKVWHLVGEVSRCSGAATPYLAKVLHGLARSGLVETKRGYRGGYRLARPSEEIRLLDIIRAVEPPRIEQPCLLGMAQCSDDRACPMHEFWKSTRNEIMARLERTTLADVARFEESRGTCAGLSPARMSSRLPARLRAPSAARAGRASSARKSPGRGSGAGAKTAVPTRRRTR